MEDKIKGQIELLRNNLKEKETYYVTAQKRGHSYEALQGLKTLIENLKKEIATLEQINKQK